MNSISSFIIPDERGEKVMKLNSDKFIEKDLYLFTSKNIVMKSRESCLHITKKPMRGDIQPKAFSEREWVDILNNTMNINRNSEKLLFSLRSGIPSKLRGNIWIYLSGAQETALTHDIDIFNKLLLFDDEEVTLMINKDIDRTILQSSNKTLENALNNNKEKKVNLFSVLKAYAAYDHEVRYCQGTNYITAIILANITSKRYAFWTFVNVMNNNKWRDLFTRNTPKLLRMIDILEGSIRKQLPLLYEHFVNQDFINEFGAVFTQFFLTIFSYNIPIEYAYRVMDLFFILEEKIIFECLLKLLSLKEDKILSMEYEEIFHYIKNDIVNDCIQDFGVEGSLPDPISNVRF